MQMGFEEEGVGARASDREIGLGFGGGYGKLTGSTDHPRIHVSGNYSEGDYILPAICVIRRILLSGMGVNYIKKNLQMLI